MVQLHERSRIGLSIKTEKPVVSIDREKGAREWLHKAYGFSICTDGKVPELHSESRHFHQVRHLNGFKW